MSPPPSKPPARTTLEAGASPGAWSSPGTDRTVPDSRRWQPGTTSIEFLGRVSDEEKRSRLRRADVLTRALDARRKLRRGPSRRNGQRNARGGERHRRLPRSGRRTRDVVLARGCGRPGRGHHPRSGGRQRGQRRGVQRLRAELVHGEARRRVRRALRTGAPTLFQTTQ